MNVTQAKTIWECTYNTKPDSYDGQKYVLKIQDTYQYTFYSYVYDHNKFAYGSGKEYPLKNWDAGITKGVREKEKCPPYLAIGYTNIFGDRRHYIYFNHEKAKERAKSFSLWSGAVVDLTEEKDMRNKTDSKTDLEDKEDGTKDVQNQDNEVIKEYKKTYPVSAMSNGLVGSEYIFYIKYNHTTKQSLSTKLTIKGNEKAVSLIYPGSIDEFSKNIIEPIVTQDVWPETFYCGEISTSLLVNPNASVSVLIGTTNIGDLVCSPDKNAFVDGTNKLSRFTTKYEGTKNKNPEIDRMPGASIDPDLALKLKKDTCEIVQTGTRTYDFIKKVVNYVKIGSIFLILVLGMVDMAGAVGSDEENAFKKAGVKFGKRLIACALIFLVPVIVEILINLMNASSCKNVETIKEIYNN